MWQRLRLVAFVALCGGTLLQTTAGCDSIIAPLMSSLVTTVITGMLSGLIAT